MEACSKAKFQRYGSRKVSFLLDLVRGKSVKAAEGMIPFAAAIWFRKPFIPQLRTFR